jgi:hypothetical protein
MTTRDEVRRTDNSKLGRAVLNSRSNIMPGLRGTVAVKVDVVAVKTPTNVDNNKMKHKEKA